MITAANERVDDLQRAGLRILQKRDGFRFGVDAVLLAEFAAPRKRERAADLGTGTGVIPLLLYGREPTITVDAVELQPDMADMAHRSVALNHAEDHIHVICADVREKPLSAGLYTLVTCNPPYHPANAAARFGSDARRFAVSEARGALEDFISAAARVLQNGGRACMVYPAQRMLTLLDGMRHARLEPKRLRFVHNLAASAPKLVLVEAVLNAKPGLVILPPFILHEADGQYTQEARMMYNQPE